MNESQVTPQAKAKLCSTSCVNIMIFINFCPDWKYYNDNVEINIRKDIQKKLKMSFCDILCIFSYLR